MNTYNNLKQTNKPTARQKLFRAYCTTESRVTKRYLLKLLKESK